MNLLDAIKRTAVVGCIYGKKFTVLHPAPQYVDSYIFSNNYSIRREAEKKGWKFIYHEVPLSDDEIVSAMQSKYIKFLQFVEEYKSFFKYKYILYCDHKTKLFFEHVSRLMGLSKKPVMLRKHNDVRRSIWDEFAAAMLQQRYSREKVKLLYYIDGKVRNGYNDITQVVLTGLILYDMSMYSEVKKLTDEIYNDLQNVHSPECQIIVSILIQKHKNIVQIIENDFFKLEHGQPEIDEPIYNKLRKNIYNKVESR